MNCTFCGKPHSKEQPLTIIEDMLPIGEVIAFCPDCLKERDKPTGEKGRVISVDDYPVVRSGIVAVGKIKNLVWHPIGEIPEEKEA